MSMKKKSLLKKYLEKLNPHLCDMIDAFKKSDEWEMHLTIKSKLKATSLTDNKFKEYDVLWEWQWHMYDWQWCKRNYPRTSGLSIITLA